MKFLKYINESDGKTQKDNTGHIHDITTDANGDGKTIGDQDHEHEILQWMIQPAKNHIHNMES
jgi:hypothetical protein